MSVATGQNRCQDRPLPQIKTLLEEGATVHACRFAMGALYGFREDDLIPGVKPFHPLDVLDSALTAWRAGAFQLNTWTV
ncbi:MAG: hypothetical protein ACRD07_22590 [Acidimicrobiales bacterium]